MVNPNNSEFIKDRSMAEQIRLDLKNEWKLLWKNKYDDKKLAEGISTEEYLNLNVKQGEIIYATKKCKSIDFYEILEKKIGKDYNKKIVPSPQIGGWRKFAKENLQKTRKEKPKINVDLIQQQRKHGKGWLNQIRINKKIKENKENF